MPKKLTIQVSDEFYDGLQRRVGKRGIGRFVEELVRPHVLRLRPGDPGWEEWLGQQYASAAADDEAEREAREWVDADLGGDDLPDEDWSWLRDAPR